MNKRNARTKALVDQLMELGENSLATRVAFANVRTQTLLFRKIWLMRRFKKLSLDLEKHGKTLDQLSIDLAKALNIFPNN